MINIRYHVYSLVAVFLALAIGVAVGSTVVQRSVVDNLKSTQGRIEKNLDDLEAQNADLQDRTAALEDRERSLVSAGPSALLGGELSGLPVVLIRVQGVSGDALGRVRDTLEAAGAEVVSDVEVKATVADADALAEVAADLGLGPDEREPEEVQAALGERLATCSPTCGTRHRRPARRSTCRPTRRRPRPRPRRARPPSTWPTTCSGSTTPACSRSGARSAMTGRRRPSDLEVLVLGGLTKDFDPVPCCGPCSRRWPTAVAPSPWPPTRRWTNPLGDGEEAHGIVPDRAGDRPPAGPRLHRRPRRGLRGLERHGARARPTCEPVRSVTTASTTAPTRCLPTGRA